MDNYENIDREEELQQEHMEEVQVQPEEKEDLSGQQYYNNAGVGRKESPYADSPYVMNRPEPSMNEKPKKAKKQRKSVAKVLKGVVAAVLGVVLVGGACTAAVAVTNRNWFEKMSVMNTEYRRQLEELEKRLERAESAAANQGGAIVGDAVSSQNMLSASQVYAMNVNSVVAISNHATTNVYGQETEMASSGSGFIISEDGYVVSNYHVVEGADTLTVITYDGTEYRAKLVGYDESNDVSLLKIDATGLDPVAIGSSDALIVGDQVVAIGNPLGELTSTLTVGYISAKDRTINTDGTYNINMM